MLEYKESMTEIRESDSPSMQFEGNNQMCDDVMEFQPKDDNLDLDLGPNNDSSFDSSNVNVKSY